MVKTLCGARQPTIVLAPNFSMSWRRNMLLVLAFAIWVGAIGLVFSLLGAWPILPFVGLEVACLAAGLWVTHKKLARREVIRLGDDLLVFEQGTWFPVSRTTLQRHSVQGLVCRPGHPLDAPQIQLFDASGNNFRVGAFLNSEDSDRLIGFLEREGIHLRQGGALRPVLF